MKPPTGIWKRAVWATGLAALGGLASVGQAQEPVTARHEKEIKELRQNLERLQKQNEQLMQMMQQSAVTPPPVGLPVQTDAAGGKQPGSREEVRSIVQDYLAETDAKKKA